MDPQKLNSLTIGLRRLPKPFQIIEALNDMNSTNVNPDKIRNLIKVWPSELISELMMEKMNNPQQEMG